LKNKLLKIHTFRDLILQKIIWMSILPISEFQADIFSFAYRFRRSALMCTSILYKHLVQTQKFLKKKYYFFEVNKTIYKKYFYKSQIMYRALLSNFGKKQRKRRKLYRKKFYVLKILKSKTKNMSFEKTFRFNVYVTIWNFEIQKCFDNINYQTIIQLTPLCDKYNFFLKQWLISPIWYSLKKDSKLTTSVKPKVGIFQGAIRSSWKVKYNTVIL
jgi:hypothetical protein